METMQVGTAIQVLLDKDFCSQDIIWFQIVQQGLNVQALDEVVSVFTLGDMNSVAELAEKDR